ncbi:tetratricopeptide repeat protein [Aeromonas enteropelogenes]|uniref:tetratricopeptide repeat protein n=1 Tax=Aeromonas enteropelogenes TaxID=29489 RepID=UPI003BA197F8
MKAVFLSALLLTTSVLAAQDKAQELYNLAVIPWERGTKEGADLMWQAADSGNAKAQCLIAKSNLQSVWVWSDISYKYFKMAADQNALCGLLALSVDAEGGVPIMRPKQFEIDNISTGEYEKRLNSTLAELVQRDDVEALKLKGFLSDNKNEECTLFEKAAQKKDPDAQFRLANKIEDGCGWYLIPGSRKKANNYWIKQAAINGHPDAIATMAIKQCDQGDYKGFFEWFDKAVDMADYSALDTMSAVLRGDKDLSVCNVPEQYLDKVRAYSYMYAIHKQVPELEKNRAALLSEEFSNPYFMSKLEKELTIEQVNSAKEWAEKWMKNHRIRTYGLIFYRFL